MYSWIDRLCDKLHNTDIKKMLEEERAAGGKIYSEDEMVIWPDDADSDDVKEFFEHKNERFDGEKVVARLREVLEKNRRYKKLIKTVADDYTKHPRENDKIKLKWCEDCKEINLWTYWQGLGYPRVVPKIDILLVGQDWGNPFTGDMSAENVKKLNTMDRHDYDKLMYLDVPDEKRFATDKNLIDLFAHIGYPDIDKKRYPELFFTNFCLGYIYEGKQSGDMTTSIMEKDSDYFKELCNILQPKVIICLGRKTFELSVKALEVETTLKDADRYNDYLEKQRNKDGIPVDLEGTKSKIYASAHCGSFGVKNRGGIDKVKADWMDIKGKSGV